MFRRRSHRVLTWIGIVTCSLILTVGAVSLRWAIRWRASSGDFGISVRCGAVFFSRDAGPFQGTVNYIPWGDIGPLGFARASGPNRFTARVRIGTGIDWPPPSDLSARTRRYVAIPLWMPLVALVIPTTALWWRDRRPIQPGRCGNCGYDLTGNVSGRCPECGEPTLARDGRAQG